MPNPDHHQTPAELAMYRAYFAWQSAYMPSLLDDINFLEAFKSGFAAHEQYSQRPEPDASCGA